MISMALNSKTGEMWRLKKLLQIFQKRIQQKIQKLIWKLSRSYKPIYQRWKNDEALKKLIDKLNKECKKFLTKNLKTTIFKILIDDLLKDFLNDLIKIRTTQTNKKKRNNIECIDI